MTCRVGIGYDLHRLVKGRKLFLGGVLIPYAKGLLGHSDADVLLHAVCDALLGSVNAGDIGEHFPDTDPAYKGSNSLLLLKQVGQILKKKHCRVNNIDVVVILQEPRLTPYKDVIRENISKALRIRQDVVSIKAKTNEGLGPTGQKKAIACYAVATVMGE